MRALLLLFSLPLAAQTASLHCGTPARPFGAFGDAASDCSMSHTNPLPSYAPTTLYRLPVVFHVIRDPSGLGDIPMSRILDQVEVLNEYYRAKPGTAGAPSVDTGIEFELATVDPLGNPSTGVTVSTNATWFQDQGSYWLSLAWDTARYVNVYTNTGGSFIGYVPAFPAQGIAGQLLDRVVIRYDVVGRNAPYGPPYDQGRLLVHELGHFLGLFHTFELGGSLTPCPPQAMCYDNGDLICDTNTHNSWSGCMPISSCGLADPIRNHMNYGSDACLREFTPEQTARMRCTLENWRPLLGQRFVFATAAVRTAGANVASLSAEPAVVGGSFGVAVDMTSTSSVLAALVAGTSPTMVPLPGNQFQLVDLAGPVALHAQWAPTFVATWQFAVPSAPQLYGMRLTLQAAHLGGPAPLLSFSNAIDLVLGAH